MTTGLRVLSTKRSSLDDLFQQRGERVHRQVAGVRGGRWQAAKRLDQVFAAQRPQIFEAAALHHLGESRAAGDGGHTSLGAEARLGYAACCEFYGKSQDVAAC